MDIALIVALVLAGLVVLWVIWTYNTFVRLVQQTKEASADIDVQMKRRYDLIPNLVETVKGYAAHEQATLTKVTELRNAAMNAGNPQAEAEANNMLSDALKSLFAVSENYPDLKANTNFLELQRELSDTENKIQAARRFYNGNVRDLKIGLQSFPGNVIGNVFNFKEEQFYELSEADSAAREPVKVNF